jgi:O-antigen/teichoic acid export membrane protein
MKEKLEEILVWSEKYTKTDMNYVVKGSFWLNISQVVSTGTGLLLSIAFAHFLTQETLGTYKYILSVTGLLGSLSLTGVGSSINRAVAKGAEGEVIKGFWLTLKWSLLITFCAIILALYYFFNDNNALAIGILIAGACAPLLDSGELYTVLLSGRKAFKGLSIYRILRTLFIFFGLFTAILLTDNPLYLITVYFFLNTFSALFLFNLVLKTEKPNSIEDPETHKLSKHLSVMNLLATVADQIDDVLVFHYLGPIQLAIYNYAVAIPNNLAGFVKQIGGLATPKYVTKDKKEVQNTLLQKSFILFCLSLPVAILYIIASPYIFEWLFRQYEASVVYSQVYSVTLLMSAVLPLAFLEAHTAIKEKYKLNVFSNVFKLAAIFIGIAVWGIWGAIFARIISKFFGVSLAFFFAKRL